MPDIIFKKFNPVSVPLQESNLIEASAGTGKTYSIAILALRLILEKELSIREILMVTFTKAAVAELEERIRLFIRQAYRASQQEHIDDQTIAALVATAIERSGKDEVQRNLREAVLFLDETSVMTIHSFCQQTLAESAFETQQLFGAELLQDTSALLEDEMNKFWRQHITGIPTDLLSLLIRNGLSRATLKDAVKEHLDGKRFLIYQPEEDYRLHEQVFEDFRNERQQLEEEEQQLRNGLLEYVQHNEAFVRDCCNQNSYAKKNVSHLCGQWPELLDAVWGKRDKVNIIKAFTYLLERLEECEEAKRARQELLQRLQRRISCFAIQIVAAGVKKTKSANNQMAFDDLIGKLHAALVKVENPALVTKLLEKYKAVFIDEFQDTDRLQYEIFEKAFSADTILFYIGDPKQSIYAWRKADIETYFRARESVRNCYDMNTNYRSSHALIQAMNHFFMPEPDFDTFHFGNEDSAIDYIRVESPEPNSKGELIFENNPALPITIIEQPTKPTICDAVAEQVLDLLTNDAYRISAKERRRKIKPADIGILVRGNREGADIKNKLAALGIPAVTIGDAKVLNSAEAKYVLYLLEAFDHISRAAINKALLSPFTGFPDFQILQLNDEQVVELFRKYKVLWEDAGVYPALNAFIADFNVKENLIAGGNGERPVTNLYQLVELLHKVQSRKKLSAIELISWLKRGIEGMETEGDEYEQRIESDEECVNIVTIHKSKGLEYKIVLAPFLDLKAENPKINTRSFRDPVSKEYVSDHKDMLTDDHKAICRMQAEQENRRLIYVAITRAVYKCFIYKSTREKSSSLSYFLDALKRNPDPAIQITDCVAQAAVGRYQPEEEQLKEVQPGPVEFSLAEKNWFKMSYSKLRAEHDNSIKNRTNVFKNAYDRFIFSDLKAGAKTGNMLHYIFENISFDDKSWWPAVIQQAIQQFFGEKEDAQLSDFLSQMLEHVLEAQIGVEEERMSLAEVTRDKRIHELEFDFNVSPFKVAELEKLSPPGCDVHVKAWDELEGFMNGKIDLFFECRGKYYILDWKSNFLGDSINDYSEDAVAAAMNENNYHLQYLIYTLAVKKYLETRLPSFNYDEQFGGVIYLFVRGLRKNGMTGIFRTKPELSTIRELGLLLNRGDVVAEELVEASTLPLSKGED